MWGKAKTGSKAGFDKIYGLVDKLGPPVNKLSNKLGAEAFWPTTLDKESDKAARILRSFCKDGFYEEEIRNTPDGIKEKQKVLKKIPSEVIRNAKGLAIFTTMRTGLWFSGAGGAGILVGRMPNGEWSPPSGLMLHTAGLGFLAGVDIYDCVMVINTTEALESFSKLRCTVGGEMSAVAGPVGIGGVVDSEVHKRRAPIFTYMKSRGLYAGIQIDGTILIERTDENESFYKQKLSVKEIMEGKVRHPPYEIRPLMATIKAAQGDEVDPGELPTEPSPSDFEIIQEKVFGVPDKEDPDPYGVLALEKEGLEIREAGTKSVAPRESFIFNPSPSSPVFKAFNRNSMDSRSMSRRSSWRTSTMSTATQTIDMATQTDFDTPATSPATSGPDKMNEIPEHSTGVVANGAYPKILESEHSDEAVRDSLTTKSVSRKLEPESDDEIVEEPAVVHAFQQATTPKFATKARLVTVTKRPPPALPPRNPVRDRKKPLIITGDNDTQTDDFHDQGTSPMSSSHRDSIVSAEEPASERSISNQSMSSIELGPNKGEEEKLKQVESHSSELDGESNFHSAASAPAVQPSSPVDAARTMPGQFN